MASPPSTENQNSNRAFHFIPLPPEPELHEKSFFEQAKHAEVVERDLNKAYSEIHSGDRFDSALKDLASPQLRTQPSSPVEYFNRTELFVNVVNGVPTGDSLYAQAVVEKVLNKACSEIHSGDRFDSALKDLESPQLRTQPSSPVEYFNRTESVVTGAPTGDSLYAQAKHPQVSERDLNKARSLFYLAIESRDRFDSALKNLASVLKRLGRTDEAIQVILPYSKCGSQQSKDSVGNLLISLYKSDGRIVEHIKFLKEKLELIEDGSTYQGKKTRTFKVQGKNIVVSIEHERSRLLGDMAWLYMLKENYHSAEQLYRKALSIEPDKNMQCNLAICFMKSGRITEAKSLLQAVTPSSKEGDKAASYIKSYDRAWEMLTELGNDQSQVAYMAEENTRKKKVSNFED